jgi:hypothetical protein
LLGQQIYTIEFAYRLTLLERRLDTLRLSDYGLPFELASTVTANLNRVRQGLEMTKLFAESAELTKLDLALGLARESRLEFSALAAQYPLLENLFVREPEESAAVVSTIDWTSRWETRVQRHRGLSRATFRCLTCGWELSYTAEVGATEQLEVPFDELECPLCQAEAATNDELLDDDSLPTVFES